jgi:hypothetical protein
VVRKMLRQVVGQGDPVRLRGLSAARFFIVPVLLAVLVLVGCGGGGDQSENGGSRGGGNGSGGEKQGKAPQGNAPQGNAPQAKVALGTIMSANPHRRKIVLRPSVEVQGGKRMVFKVRKDAEISLNDQPAEMADVKHEQAAQIEYIVKNEKNRARAVALISSGEGTGR